MPKTSKKQFSTGKGTTCIVCRAAKVRCDRGSPCGRCVRLSKTCIPSPPSRRGKWQTEQALVRQLQNLNKRKKTKAKTCMTKIFLKTMEKNLQGVKPFHFGSLHIIRTLIFKALLRNNWEYFASVSRVAKKIGIPVKDVFFESNQQDVPSENIFSRVQRALLEHPPPTITWADVPDAVATVSQLGLLHEPEGWVFAIQKTCGKSRFYVSPSFGRDVVSMEDLIRLGEVNILKRLFPKKELPQTRKQYTKVFLLYSRENSPPVRTQFATHIILKNKTVKKVLMKNYLYIEDGYTSTLLCEVVEWKKRNELHRPLGTLASSVDGRKGMVERSGVEHSEMEGLENMDLFGMDISADDLAQLFSEWP